MRKKLIFQSDYNDRNRNQKNWVQLEQYPLNTQLQQNNYEGQRNIHPYQKFSNQGAYLNNFQVPSQNYCFKQQQEYIGQNHNQTIGSPNYPKQIVMNGNAYRVGPQVKIADKKSKIPEMAVKCIKCQTDQMVPGTTDKFKCCTCRNIHDCCPAYKILICGYCRSKFGVNQMHKMPKHQSSLNTVNPYNSRK